MYILDRKTMAQAEQTADAAGTSFFRLMQNAGTAAAEYILSTERVEGKKTVCLCGCGNNGGDGFIIADRLNCEGAEVTVVLTHGKPQSPTAERAFSILNKEVAVTEDFSCVTGADIIVDAVFGTGLSREVDERTAELFRTVNKSGAAVFAVDLPSGINADTGRALGQAVRADYTTAFAALKYCHILPEGVSYCGETVCLDIGIEDRIMRSLPQRVKAIKKPATKKRDKLSHKGTYGTALSVTGSYGMSGAAIISGKAALRSGIGILKLACIEENYTVCAVSLPEAVLIPCKSEGKTFSCSCIDLLKKETEKASALLIGCGLGVSRDAERLVRELLLSSSVPVILDADGINNIYRDIEFIKQVKAPLILTPHPAEMARLCGKTAAEVEADRIGTACRFAEEYGVYLCLKGTNTIVATPDGEVFVNLIGNAGMAVGGSGDMLAGVILALAARGETALDAVCSGVWLHSAAGDAARDKRGETSMLPSDMIEELYRFF